MISTKFSGLRDFFLIWSGQLISVVGSRLSSFALGIWVLRSTGSPTDFAMTFVAMSVPALLVSSVAGVVADRWNRRNIMMVCDVLAGTSLLVLVALGLSGKSVVWAVYCVVGAESVFDGFRGPAFTSSISLLARPDQLPRVNGLAQTGSALAEIIGPLCAGVLVSVVSLRGILVLDALTFAVGALTLAAAQIPDIPRSESTSNYDDTGLVNAAFLGWRYLSKQSGLIGVIAIISSNSFLLSIACVVIAPLLLSFASSAQLGVQYAIGGFGLLIGSGVIAAWGGPRKRVQGILGSTAIAGLSLATHGFRPSLLLISAAGFILFATIPIVAASSNSLFQTKIPSAFQGRIFAIQLMIGHTVTILGYCLAGPLATHIFEPLLLRNGPLSTSLGMLIGVGPQRGLGLLFIVLGSMMFVSSIIAYSVPEIRHLDDVSDTTTASISDDSRWSDQKTEWFMSATKE
jgi:DHA3 family macrolide efflux protein-like MFS transporter